MHLTLFRDKHGMNHYVHRLVAEAFLGPCPEGQEVNHKDVNRGNNRLDNLEYVTSSRNKIHAGEMRGSYRGERHSQAKLTEQDVREIRRLYSDGIHQHDLACQYGLCDAAIAKVVHHITWKFVP
jgi:hypothetical protein